MSNQTPNAETSARINRIKSLFNWGELSRLLSGTRSVVLKDKYPKKHEAFISDLCDAVEPVLAKHGYLTVRDEILPSVEFAESFE